MENQKVQSTLGQLKGDLADPQKFQDFVSNPTAFVARYGISLDSWLEAALQRRLAGHTTLTSFQIGVAMQLDGIRPVAVGGGQ